MKRIFLCGNTGSVNRGCEAIVDATVKVLNCRKGDIYLATFAPDQDRSLTSRIGINMITYNTYPTKIHRYFYAGIRKVFNRSLAGLSLIQNPLFDLMTSEDISLNIGGDTYCYSRPINSLALNKYTYKKGIPNILWCCSIEKDSINREMFEDLNRYKYIFAREQITVENLRSSGIDENKIVKVCDPAFFLDTKETELPDNFVENNTVGINLSEMVINGNNPAVWDCVLDTVRYIIDKTDMNVCLIPHVYSIKNNRNDYPILKAVYDEIKSDRISIVDRELNCRELKHIISKCKFFMGARTHSTIAAYSSGVPTLVLGYSVKSKGIATDLFGTYNGYVIPYTDITENNEMLRALKNIFKKEQEIKDIYKSVLPEYKRQLTDAIEKYLSFDDNGDGCICTREICSGCGACYAKCPTNAITMVPDELGFLYPEIERDKCINCGLCRKICPSANKFVDYGKKPQAYAVVNKDNEVRIKSSSGGVFSLIAEKVIANGGVVFGAAFNDDMSVTHIKCNSLEQLERLRGSKYSQSITAEAYREAKKCLDEGVTVLFTGTPCQIDGLYAFLGKDYDNLYTQDIVCHSVPSPSVWRDFVAEHSQGRKISNIFFRDKTYGWDNYSMRVDYSDGKSELISSDKNEFMKGFINGIYTRNSCSLCSSRRIQRRSDITLGDFWGIQAIDDEFNDNKGVSLVMVHSAKGSELLQGIDDRAIVKEKLFEHSVKNNPAYYRSPKPNNVKKYFLKEYKKGIPPKKIVKKYLDKGLLSKIRRLIIKSK